MRKLKFGWFLAFAALVAAAAVAYSTWGVLGLAGVFAIVVVSLFAMKLLAGRILQALFLLPFKMKGKVLRGARLEVHNIAPAEAPAFQGDDESPVDDEDFDTPEAAEEYRQLVEADRREESDARRRRRWFFVDLTIAPQEQSGDGFKHWEPGDLTVVEPASDPVESYKSGEDDEIGEIAEVMIWDAARGSFCGDEQCKYVGPLRLRLHLGVEPGHTQVAFRYYFEQFGDLRLIAE